MSDAQARTTGSARRSPLPLAAAAVLLAFLAGLTLMAIATGRYHWPAPLPTPVATQTPAVASAAAGTPRATSSIVAPAVQPATMPADPAVLAGREVALAAQLAAIEARLPAVNADAAAAATQAGRAETLLLAFAARRAIDRGLGLGAFEAPFRTHFGAVQPRATALIVAGARAPLTLEELRASVDALAPTLVSGGDDWWQRVRGGLRSLFVIHRADAPSPVPADRLARVHRLLAAGQVEPALAEVGQMPGAAGAANWMAAARRYVEVHRALDVVEAAALAAPPPLPVLPVAPSVAPVAPTP